MLAKEGDILTGGGGAEGSTVRSDDITHVSVRNAQIWQ